jgi:hypothetical protein
MQIAFPINMILGASQISPILALTAVNDIEQTDSEVCHLEVTDVVFSGIHGTSSLILAFLWPSGARHLPSRLTNCLGDDFDQVDACILGGILQVVLHHPHFSIPLSRIHAEFKPILGVRVRPRRFAEAL